MLYNKFHLLTLIIRYFHELIVNVKFIGEMSADIFTITFNRRNLNSNFIIEYVMMRKIDD
jgi:hypothetical protein